MALLLTLGMLPVAVFYQALSCLIQVKQKWRHRFLLATGSFLLIFMVIFTGDSVNFTCAILFFLFCMWVACKGTRLKRVTIGLMLASTILALNGLYDSCITSLPYFGLGLNDLWYLLFRLASTLFLYLCIRHNKPECDFELAPSLWRLILLLCIPPLGIVFSLVMFAPYDRSDDLILYTALFWWQSLHLWELFGLRLYSTGTRSLSRRMRWRHTIKSTMRRWRYSSLKSAG